MKVYSFTCWRQKAPETSRKWRQLQWRPGRPSPGQKPASGVSGFQTSGSHWTKYWPFYLILCSFVRLLWVPWHVESDSCRIHCCQSKSANTSMISSWFHRRVTTANVLIIKFHLNLGNFLKLLLALLFIKCGDYFQWRINPSEIMSKQ